MTRQGMPSFSLLRRHGYLLLGAYFVLFLAVHTIVPVGYRLSLIALACFATLWTLLRLCLSPWLKEPEALNLVLTLACFLFFTYGRFYEFLPLHPVAGVTLRSHGIVLPLVLALGCLGLFIIARLSGPSRIRIGTGMAVMALTLLCELGVQQVIRHDRVPTVRLHLSKMDLATPAQPGDQKGQHNLYLILLDSYMGSEALARHYQIKNDVFLEGLKSKGFKIAQRSYSNYPFTLPSMASAFNMEYIHQTAGAPAHPGSLWALDRLGNNRLFQMLGENGYRIGIVGGPMPREEWLDHSSISLIENQYLVALVQSSMLLLLERFTVVEGKRLEISGILDILARAPKARGPFFLYSHILCPHGPFVFTETGGKPNLATTMLGNRDLRAGYAHQVAYISIQVDDLVARILREDPSDPVIIIQGDHGMGAATGHGLNHPGQPPDFFLDAQMSILLAVRVPEGMINPVYNGMTPANLYRGLANGMFGAGLPQLPDRNFYSPFLEPWAFQEVTAKLNGITP